MVTVPLSFYHFRYAVNNWSMNHEDSNIRSISAKCINHSDFLHKTTYNVGHSKDAANFVSHLKFWGLKKFSSPKLAAGYISQKQNEQIAWTLQSPATC
jgi:hypothetical protein